MQYQPGAFHPPLAPLWTRGPRLFLLLLVIATVVRAQTFGNPVIEFDELFYRLVGERMLHGALPYVDIWDRKPIGLFMLYAFAALVGAEHALSYQLLATLFVALTALLIHAMARRICSGWLGPLIAAIFYILWLNLLQGEGGQASVFTTLPVCGAALLVLRHVDGTAPIKTLGRDGALAMLLIGLAAQIKYTVVFEGIYLGLMLLWLGWRSSLRPVRLTGYALLWIALALFPSFLAWGVYVQIGHGQDWLFANIFSIFLRRPMPLSFLIEDIATVIATLLLPAIAAVLTLRVAKLKAPMAFFIGWALVALLAILPLRTFGPHYFIPFMPALAILGAPSFETRKKFALVTGLLALIVGQILIGYLIYIKGDARTVKHMVAAIGPVPNCLYVFDGFASLYLEANSCLPTRYAFSGHLNMAVESGAIGVDPLVEVRRILANRPDAIVVDDPWWPYGNLEAQALVKQALAAHYTLVLREPTGTHRWRLVYRVKPQDAHR